MLSNLLKSKSIKSSIVIKPRLRESKLCLATQTETSVIERSEEIKSECNEDRENKIIQDNLEDNFEDNLENNLEEFTHERSEERYENHFTYPDINEIKILKTNIMTTLQQVDLVVQPEQADWIYKLEPPLTFSSSPVNLKSVNLNGNFSCSVISHDISFVSLVDGAKKKTVEIKSNKQYTSEELITLITTDTGIKQADGEPYFEKEDPDKALALQFLSNDFSLIGSLLGLTTPDEAISGKYTTYEIVEDWFPENFQMELFNLCQVQLGWAAPTPVLPNLSDPKQIPINLKVKESFPIGQGITDPVVLPSKCCDPLGQIKDLKEMGYIRVRLATPDNNITPKFQYKLPIILVFENS